MPLLTRTFLKAAFVYLILAMCAGILLALPGDNLISGLFPAYLHMLTFGWLSQLIFGVALWMFPKFNSDKPRGYEWIGWVTFISLNAGLALRIIFEPLQSIKPSLFGGWMLVTAAILQWLASIAFAINTSPRVREK
ncbi:MAG: hypothetical protein HYZ22_20730 [Chloroflexi bacterium]|nr:hypothetical protein [Chloroflexota bacterium]